MAQNLRDRRIMVKPGGGTLACICYKMSSGREAHPITWQTVGMYPCTEAGFHEAIRLESRLIDSDRATRIIRGRDNDCRRVWMVQQCKPWKCCTPENADTDPSYPPHNPDIGTEHS